MSDPITFALTQRQARALIAAISSDHAAPAEARAACNALWEQISGPAPVTDPAPRRSAPARTLRPVAGRDYSRYSAEPLTPARACKLLEILVAEGAADPIGMARALTGRDITSADQISEAEGMQLLDLLQHRRAELARAKVAQPKPAAAPQPDPRTVGGIEQQAAAWLS